MNVKDVENPKESSGVASAAAEAEADIHDLAKDIVKDVMNSTGGIVINPLNMTGGSFLSNPPPN